MAKDLVKKEKGDDAYSRILRYMQYPEEVSLISSEEKILDRWIMVNTLLKDRKMTEEMIIEKIVKVHSVSKFTARNDIGYAMALFVEARRYAKEYLLYNHIEDIGLTIQKWKLDKSLAAHVPKLYQQYTLAISKLPDAQNNKEKPKVVNNFFLVQGQNINTAMPYEDAMQSAEEFILEDEKEFTEFDEVDDDESA